MKSNTRHLRPEDLRGKRWRGLVRESTERQAEKWSPTRQRNDLRRAADELGLVGSSPEFYERTGSGEAEGADELARALADAKDGQYEVLLVLHTSRFARNVAESRRVKTEARKIGLVIYFVEQRILSGALTSSLHEGIAEVIDEQENLTKRMWISGGHRERQLAGQWLGNIPVGYRKRMDERPDRTVGWGGYLEPDPVYAPIVRRIFDEFATGTSPFDIAYRLNAEGIRRENGELWRRAGIVRVLHNPAYKGVLVRYRDHRDDHYYPEDDPQDGRREMPLGTSLIEPTLFDQVQTLIASRAVLGSAHRPHRQYPLSRVLRCAACGRGMTGVSNGSTRYYRCHGRAELGICREPFVRAEDAEGAFAAWLDGFRLPDDWRTVLLARERPKKDDQARKERLTAAMARLKQQFVWGDVPEADYRAQMSALRSELATTTEASDADLERFAYALVEMGSAWLDIPMEKQAAVVRLILSEATVTDGKITEWVVRASVRPILELCVPKARSFYPVALRYTA